MDVEVMIHGVPHGESYYGVEEERGFCLTNYDSDKNSQVKFLIQVRELSGKRYCYYHYLVKKDVVDDEGRAGSYFGMTIRTDEYWLNFGNVFRLLDLAFNGYVAKNILKKNEVGGYKYLVSSFKDTGEEIKKKVENLILSSMKGELRASLGQFSLIGGDFPSENLYEVSEKSVITALKQYGGVALSPYYPTRKTQSLLNEKEAACKRQLSDKDEQIRLVRKELAEAKSETTEKVNAESRKWEDKIRSQRSDYESKIGQLEEDLRKAKSETNSKIDEATREMREKLQSQKSDFETKLDKARSETKEKVEEEAKKWHEKIQTVCDELHGRKVSVVGKFSDGEEIGELRSLIKSWKEQNEKRTADFKSLREDLDRKQKEIENLLKKSSDNEEDGLQRRLVSTIKELQGKLDDFKESIEEAKGEFCSQKETKKRSEHTKRKVTNSDDDDENEDDRKKEKNFDVKGFFKKFPWKMALLIGGVVLALVLLGVLLFAVL